MSSAESISDNLQGTALTVSKARPNASSVSGPGYLSIFQQASSTSLNVSIDGGAPVTLPADKFSSGLIASGNHTITATNGAMTVATGVVTVPAGQHVTALVYLAPGSTPTVSYTHLDVYKRQGTRSAEWMAATYAGSSVSVTSS